MVKPDEIPTLWEETSAQRSSSPRRVRNRKRGIPSGRNRWRLASKVCSTRASPPRGEKRCPVGGYAGHCEISHPYGSLPQLAEGNGSNPFKFRFESEVNYQNLKFFQIHSIIYIQSEKHILRGWSNGSSSGSLPEDNVRIVRSQPHSREDKRLSHGSHYP